MKNRVRELIDYGKLCGFVLTGMDGKEHHVLTHPNGSTVRVANSPGDYRGDDNCRAEMRRKSGVRPARPRSGRYRKGVRAAEYVPAEHRVDSTSARFAMEAREHRALCDRIGWMQAQTRTPHLDRDLLSALEDLEAVESRIQALGRPIPRRTYRLIPEGASL